MECTSGCSRLLFSCFLLPCSADSIFKPQFSFWCLVDFRGVPSVSVLRSLRPGEYVSWERLSLWGALGASGQTPVSPQQTARDQRTQEAKVLTKFTPIWAHFSQGEVQLGREP